LLTQVPKHEGKITQPSEAKQNIHKMHLTHATKYTTKKPTKGPTTLYKLFC